MHKTTGLDGIPVVDLTKLSIGRILAMVNEFDKSQMLNVDRDTRQTITPAKKQLLRQKISSVTLWLDFKIDKNVFENILLNRFYKCKQF